MTEYLLSIDPGKSTGVALLAYNDDAVGLERAWQFGGGAPGLIGFLSRHTMRFRGEDTIYFSWGEGWTEKGFEAPSSATTMDRVTVLAEKFTARNTHGFSYTTDSLEPLRCEGVLLALGLMPDYTPAEKRWRDPGLQYLVGGKDRATKKKRQHRFLKDSGFYRTGKDLGSPDADDYRSACAHGIAYLARELKNKAAFKLITDWTEANQ